MNNCNILRTADCAWMNCNNHDCLVVNNKNGKLKYLSCCPDHKVSIGDARDLYKKISKLYQEIDLRY